MSSTETSGLFLMFQSDFLFNELNSSNGNDDSDDDDDDNNSSSMPKFEVH